MCPLLNLDGVHNFFYRSSRNVNMIDIVLSHVYTLVLFTVSFINIYTKQIVEFQKLRN